MIELTTSQQALLTDPLAEDFFCVQIKDIFATSHHSQVTTQAYTFVPSGILAQIAPPETSSSVDRSLYEVTLVDSHADHVGLYEQDLIGSVLHVQIGFVDPATGLPDIDSLFTLYKGIVQGFDVTFETEVEGQIVLKVTGSNPMAALDGTSSFYTNRASARALNPVDSAFDQVYEGSRSLTLLWGKN